MKNPHKALLSIFMSLILIFSLLPSSAESALAAPAKPMTEDGNTTRWSGEIKVNENRTIENGVTITKDSDPVAQTGGRDYTSINAAIDAAADKGVVKLLKDVIIADNSDCLTCSAGKDITLDLNNHFILCDKDSNVQNPILTVSGQLTLTDSSNANSLHYFALDDDGLVTGVIDAPVGVEGTNYITVKGGFISGGTHSGVYVNGGSFTMTGATICGNSNDNEGGGVLVDKGGKFEMSGGEIRSNKAYHAGGGVCIIGGKFTLSDGKIANNNVTSSGGYGGGVHVTLSGGNDGLTVTRSTFKMSGGEIKGNTAESSSNAGGVSVIGSTFTMTGGKIEKNVTNHGYGGGVFVSLGSDKYNNKVSGAFEISGGEIEGNTANNAYGGGVYVNGGGSLTMTDGKINSNTAGFNGGGVYVCKDSSLTMSDGEINSNTAETSGGGVYIEGGGSLAMSGGKINSNTATKYGGGVYVYFGSRATMSGGEIKNNKAGNCGGGMFINSTFEISGAPEINGNIVKDKKDNVCLFKENTTYSLITITSALANKAYIGVCIWEENDTNDYIYNDLEFAKPGDNYTLTPADVSHFTSDDDDYAPILNESGNAKFVTGYKVKVEDGSGSGTYAEGVSVTIKANAPEKGKRFKEWEGTDDLTFTSGTRTTETVSFTMKAEDVTLKAIYEDIPEPTKYAVTVNGGTGGGNYAEGTDVTIKANAPEEGKEFKAWTGADDLIFTSGSITTETATFTMPANAVILTATYEEKRDPDNPEDDPKDKKIPISDPGSPEHRNDGSGTERVDPTSAHYSFDFVKNPVAVANTKADLGGALKALSDYDNSAKHRFKSTDNKKAKIDKKGMLTPKKAGEVDITCEQKQKGGKWTELPDKLHLFIQLPEMEKSYTVSLTKEQLSAYELLKHTTYSPTAWDSTNKGVATVDKDGNITLLKAGKTNIIAIYGEGKTGSKKKYKTKLIVAE